MNQAIKDILIFTGGNAVFTGLLWTLFSKILSDQLNSRTNAKIQLEVESVRSKYTTELEAFRNSNTTTIEATRNANTTGLEILRNENTNALEAIRNANTASLEVLRIESTRNLEGIRNENSTALEELRNEIGERREVLKSSMDFMSSGYAASQERRLKAIEHLWSIVLEVRSITSTYLLVYDYCLPHEYTGELNTRVTTLIGNTPRISENDFTNKLIEATKGAEAHRPIVGESLWRVYRAYTAFQGRLSLRVVKAFIAQTSVPIWNVDDDQVTYNGKPDSALAIAETVLTKEELAEFLSYRIGVPQEISEAIRLKLLDQMNLAIFNKVLVHESLAERQRIAKLLR